MQDLKNRCEKFAIETGELIPSLPRTINASYSNHLILSTGSPWTNYRSARRGKSTAGVIIKLKIDEEELDGPICFLELIEHFNPDNKVQINALIKESNKLLAITVQYLNTARINSRTS